MKKQPKIFVLDTNVILHDYKCIYNFQENDIVIPIPVLEELDKFKKGNDLINFHAREFTRELDRLSGDNLFSGGVPLGDGLGRLSVETGKAYSEKMRESFPEQTPDHRILAIADYIREHSPSQQVTLVTKDINLRMKAKSMGVMSADYENDKVKNIDEIYKEIYTLQGIDDALISKLYAEDGEPVPASSIPIAPRPNQYFILKGDKSSALVHYQKEANGFDRVIKRKAAGIEPRNAEQTFALDALLRPEIQLVSLTGKAGTGKTLLALAAAIEQRDHFSQIFLARPIVPLSNRDIGFLPGEAKDKIGPYMQPLFDNLEVVKSFFGHTSKEMSRIDELVKSEKLVITPLAFIRGRSLSNVFFIVDEAQNLTPHEVKTVITRCGEGTKIVFSGDIEQIDTPYLDSKSNGLSYLTDKMAGQELFAHINLVKGERSYLAELASQLL